MRKLKLSVAQLEMLDACRHEDGAYAVAEYPPVKKLLSLGYIEDRPQKLGPRYFITDAGRAALEQQP